MHWKPNVFWILFLINLNAHIDMEWGELLDLKVW